ncbi:MAG: hypothetical protein AVDCRST_MAG68-1575 [uncultured Gemmatimonadetes bacterium]|uniref:DUF3667 domain-containing protein n=1 Tax=uncultured Gemmatimonadota bacterium TaxID=203437 RepID=A0A6J4KWW8_9BACT|nr:MAG: hypothetical protein AVDCRST_MAG68-1575 [uncultured Gemmatimonadota bacterium]
MTLPSPAAEESRPAPPRTGPPARPCPNCGTWVDDRFCPRCGQRNAERLVSVRRIVRESLEDQFAVNGTLPRTLASLFLRPGLLTDEYAAGRIARYVSPLRLYLLASVVFFIFVSWITNPDRVWQNAEPALRQWQARHPGEQPKVINLGLDTLAAPAWTRPVSRRLLRQQDRVNALGPMEGLRVQIRGFQANAPRAAFLLVPAFAGLLQLLYLRRRRLYVEHFVFALHVQTFAFLVASAGLVMPALPSRNLVLMALLLGYLLLAMKRVYPQSWPMTLLKYAAVLTAYGFVLAATVLVLMVLALFMW